MNCRNELIFFLGERTVHNIHQPGPGLRAFSQEARRRFSRTPETLVQNADPDLFSRAKAAVHGGRAGEDIKKLFFVCVLARHFQPRLMSNNRGEGVPFFKGPLK